MTVGMLKARILSEYDRRSVMARTTSSSTTENNEGGIATTASNCNNNNNNTNLHSSNHGNEERYLRLIIRGRMMAPDRNTLASFCIVSDDVIHAVLTTYIQPSTSGGGRGGIMGSGGSGSITRRGHQARMLHRMNNNSNSNTSERGGGAIPSLWRRTGIDYNGIVVPSRDMTNNNNNNNNNDDDDSTSSSEDTDDDDEYNDIARGCHGHTYIVVRGR